MARILAVVIGVWLANVTLIGSDIYRLDVERGLSNVNPAWRP